MAVVRDQGCTPLLREAASKLAGALAAAGFETVDVDAASAFEGATARAGAEGVLATVGFRPVRGAAAIDVCIEDSLAQKASVHRVAVPSGSRSAASRELALHAVEHLRASLLEVAPSPARRGWDMRAPRARDRAAVGC